MGWCEVPVQGEKFLLGVDTFTVTALKFSYLNTPYFACLFCILQLYFCILVALKYILIIISISVWLSQCFADLLPAKAKRVSRGLAGPRPNLPGAGAFRNLWCPQHSNTHQTHGVWWVCDHSDQVPGIWGTQNQSIADNPWKEALTKTLSICSSAPTIAVGKLSWMTSTIIYCILMWIFFIWAFSIPVHSSWGWQYQEGPNPILLKHSLIV